MGSLPEPIPTPQKFNFDYHHAAPGTVFDIGGSKLSTYHERLLDKMFLVSKTSKQRVLPSALLYDDVGLQIWKQITRLPDYYQTRDEIELLKHHGEEIAGMIKPGCTLIDLGSGDGRKLKPLLDQLEVTQKKVNFFALDLSRPVLEENLQKLAKKYRYVRCFGLWGSFDNGLMWSKTIPTPKWFLSLGSQLGNDFFEPAVARLSSWVSSMGPQDRMLLGMDAHEDVAKIWKSYHDPKGVFERFIRNGLESSNNILGKSWYRAEDWTIVGVFQDRPIMHRFVIRAMRNVVEESLGLDFAAGDEIDCYEAFKYQPWIMRQQFERAGLEELVIWKAPGAPIYEYLLSIKPSKMPDAARCDSSRSFPVY